MALKYFFEYEDLEGTIIHRCEIDDPDFVGSATEISGTVDLDQAGIDDLLDAIRGTGLRIDLEANSNLTFEDLQTDDPRKILVSYFRNGVLLFTGFLNSEGWFEDFVNSEWIVSFDCLDGLGFLKDLAFVDSSGFPFTGKKTMLFCMVNALKRTGQSLPINVDIDIRWDGLADADEVLANTQVFSERYVRDDGETIFSCDEVIRDILEPFTATVIFHEGEWYIFRPIQCAEQGGQIEYFRYDADGNPLTPATETKNILFTLGSQINGFFPHHAGNNQQITIKNAIGAFRINYRYGQAQSLLSNPFMIYDPDGPPFIPGWTDSGSIYISYPLSGGAGVALTLREYGDPQIVELESEAVTLGIGLVLQIRVAGLLARFPFPGYDATLYFQVVLEDAGSSDEYFLKPDSTWDLNNTNRVITYTSDINASFLIEQNTAPLPVAGDIKLRLLTAQGQLTLPGGGTGGGQFNVSEFSLNNLSEESGDGLEGEFHTFERISKPSAEVKENKEVATGDNATENYVGAIYKNDGTTTTSIWNRIGKTDELPILGLMGYEIMRGSQNASKVFSGDVYGFFSNFCIVAIDGFDGFWIPIRWSYNSQTNLVSMEVRRLWTEEIDTDLEYTITFDYGNVVEPTIKG